MQYSLLAAYSLWGEWSACSAQGIQTRQRQCLHPQKCRQQDVINRTGQGRSCSTGKRHDFDALLTVVYKVLTQTSNGVELPVTINGGTYLLHLIRSQSN